MPGDSAGAPSGVNPFREQAQRRGHLRVAVEQDRAVLGQPPRAQGLGLAQHPAVVGSAPGRVRACADEDVGVGVPGGDAHLRGEASGTRVVEGAQPEVLDQVGTVRGVLLRAPAERRVHGVIVDGVRQVGGRAGAAPSVSGGEPGIAPGAADPARRCRLRGVRGRPRSLARWSWRGHARCPSTARTARSTACAPSSQGDTQQNRGHPQRACTHVPDVAASTAATRTRRSSSERAEVRGDERGRRRRCLLRRAVEPDVGAGVEDADDPHPHLLGGWWLCEAALRLEPLVPLGVLGDRARACDVGDEGGLGLLQGDGGRSAPPQQVRLPQRTVDADMVDRPRPQLHSVAIRVLQRDQVGEHAGIRQGAQSPQGLQHLEVADDARLDRGARVRSPVLPRSLDRTVDGGTDALLGGEVGSVPRLVDRSAGHRGPGPAGTDPSPVGSQGERSSVNTSGRALRATCSAHPRGRRWVGVSRT